MEKTTQMHSEQTGFQSLDLFSILTDVAKRWLVIVAVTLLVGVASYIVTDLSYAPVYKTNTTFVVTSRSSSTSVYTNLSTTNSLATVFSELINSSVLRKTILAEIGETSFDGQIDASVISGTNLMTLSVTASNPRTAFLVTRAIIDHHEEITYQVVDGVTLEVLQSPAVPASPSNYSNAMGTMKKMMLLAAVCTCAVLAAISYCTNTVRNSTDARQKLDCTYLGEIPHEHKYKTLLSRLRRRKTGILINIPTTGFQFIENIRKLRSRVEHRMGEGNVLIITSLLENEGKSTVAVNLALSLAQKHSKVLLIDCDLRKPACHILLEQKNIKHGLRDVLTGKSDVAGAITRYRDSNLYMLLENTNSGNAATLISSENTQALISWARNEFDYIILDLPPMAVAADAERIMEYADASLLVIRQNTATVPSLNKAVSTLNSGKAKLVGCVLNNVYSVATLRGHHYGNRYGYGYGHYGYQSRK